MIRFNLLSPSRRRIFVLASTALLFAFLIWFLNSLPYKNVWNRFYTEKEIGTFFCEKTNMADIVRQPINTFSNFIYWLTAVVVINRGWKDRTKKTRYNIISANPFYSLALGVILLYIFCSSVFFHSSLIHFAGELDFSAVYSLSLFPLMYFTHRVWLLRIGVPSNQRHRKSTATVIIAATILYLLLTFGLTGGIFRNYVVMSIVISILVFGVIVERSDRGKTNHYYLLTAAVSILFAMMWFAFDVYKVLCDPNTIIQPHSLWHLFSGIAIFYFYMYIRSEKNKI